MTEESIDGYRRARGNEVLATLWGVEDGDIAYRELEARFSGPLAELTNDFCLGDIWSRPVFDRRTRSLLVLAALTAQGSTQPMRAHIKGALHHGASREEVREVFVQMAAYAGFPRATTAAQVAEEVFREMDS